MGIDPIDELLRVYSSVFGEFEAMAALLIACRTATPVQSRGKQEVEKGMGALRDWKQVFPNSRFEGPVTLGQAELLGTCSIGAFSYVEGVAHLHNTDVGRFCSIARGVVAGPGEHPIENMSTHLFTYSAGTKFSFCPEMDNFRTKSAFKRNRQRTTIGNDVWIGAGAFVRRGVTVGDGAIIGAHALVLEDVEPYAIVVGTPAKRTRYRFDEATRARLLRLKWWEYYLDRSVVGDLDYSNVDQTLNTIEAQIAAGTLPNLAVVIDKHNLRLKQLSAAKKKKEVGLLAAGNDKFDDKGNLKGWLVAWLRTCRPWFSRE